MQAVWLGAVCSTYTLSWPCLGPEEVGRSDALPFCCCQTVCEAAGIHSFGAGSVSWGFATPARPAHGPQQMVL
jgi:hypothetical protein